MSSPQICRGSASPMHPIASDFATHLRTCRKTIGDFTLANGLNRYAIYVFDYGAQNGNAYEEGLSHGNSVGVRQCKPEAHMESDPEVLDRSNTS